MANRRFIDFPIASTVGDNDIILIWQDGLNKQTTKATILTGISQDLASLTDVDLTGLTNGQILRYNSVTSKWENTDQGNLDLNDLNDVTIVSPSNGQVLVYNSTTSKWENSSGGYVPYIGAVTTVDLGAQQLKAGHTTLTTNGSTETLTINHTSGSGKAINVTKGGAGEGLYVNKTSGSGNAATIVGTLEATTLVKTGGISAQFLKADGSVDSTTYQSTADKGQPNGYASLDGNGKVPLTQINDALIGNVNFQGLWNASTNTPTLVDPPSSGTKGYYYIVSTGGTFAGITFEVGDWIISNGTAWGKVDNTDAVSSVFGRTGNVTASNGDYNTSQVTESGNLYYTDARSRAALSFAAGSGAYNSGTGVITIPTNNNQITNGAGYITSAALAGYLPLTGGTLTGDLNGTSASFTNASGAFIGVTATTTDATGSARLRVASTGGNINDFSSFSASHPVRANQAWIGGDGNSTVTVLQAGGIEFLRGASTGAATFSSSVTANSFIKSGGTSSQFLKADGSVDSTTYGTGTVTSVGLSSATSGVTIGSTPVTTSGTITLAIATASGSQNGLLSSTDWTNFNNKQNALTNPVTGTGTTNYLPKFTGTSTIGNSNVQDSGSLVTINSETKFQVSANATRNVYFGTSATNYGRITYNDSTGELAIGTIENYSTLFISNNTTKMTLFSSGNFLVGTGSDNGAKLQVNGGGAYIKAGNGNQLLLDNAGERFTQINFSNNTVSKANIWWDNTNTELVLLANSAGSGHLRIASTGAATFSSSVTAVGLFSTTSAGGTLSAKIKNGITAASGSTGYGLAIESEASAATSYALTVRNLAESITYFHISTETGKVGNVGIGTTSPAAKLDIIGPSAASSPYLSKAIQFAPSNFPTRTWSLNYDDGGAAGYGFNISAASTKILYLNANGNVGIGTASPTEILHLNKTSGTGCFIRFQDTGGGGVYIGGRSETMELYAGNSERMRIFSDGNVLIQSGGTFSNNGARLQVSGTSTFSGNVTIGQASAATNVKLIFNGVASKAAGIEFQQSGTPQWYIGNGIASEDNNFELYNSNGTMAMKIIKSTNAINFIGAATFSSSVTAGGLITGQAGIYQSNASEVIASNKFSTFNGGATDMNFEYPASGSVTFTNGTPRLTLASTGAATFSSSVTATSFFESSDASLKTLVVDNYQAKGIDSVVAKLYIKNGKEELGYYAQDLQGVLPSAVSKGSDGLLNLSYREVHTAKIAYLEEKIKQLEHELGRISK
jgi:hypothetical protein